MAKHSRALLVIPWPATFGRAVRADIHTGSAGAVLGAGESAGRVAGLVIGSTVNPKQIVWSSPSSWCRLPFRMRLLSMGVAENNSLAKVRVLFNPIVYMSEGLRAASLLPSRTCPGGRSWCAVVSSPPAGTLGLRGYPGKVLS